MKLKELFGYTGEEQTIELIIKKWSITAPADALECCLNDEVLEGTITGINADDDTLVVCASCMDKEHDGREGCRYFDLEEEDEPCAHCKGTAVTPEVYRARRDCYERCEEEGK